MYYMFSGHGHVVKSSSLIHRGIYIAFYDDNTSSPLPLIGVFSFMNPVFGSHQTCSLFWCLNYCILDSSVQICVYVSVANSNLGFVLFQKEPPFLSCTLCIKVNLLQYLFKCIGMHSHTNCCKRGDSMCEATGALAPPEIWFPPEVPLTRHSFVL